MKKYYLYAHGGSHNHGCEAIVRSTIDSLDLNKENSVLISSEYQDDIDYEIDKLINVIPTSQEKQMNKFSFVYLKAYWDYRLHNDKSIAYLNRLNGIVSSSSGVALSIGGDNYCYGDPRWLSDYHKAWKRMKQKTVLWGCSIDKNVLDRSSVLRDIASYDLITARESYTYEMLKKINQNTLLVADSAFILGKKEPHLPDDFLGMEFVGINIGSLTDKYEKSKGITFENYCSLVKYILDKTDYGIMLVPHVNCYNTNDLEPQKLIYDKYGHTGRVLLVNECGCEDIKGYISKCKFFVCSRTHASIAAYSTIVPTLVVGYSIKSRGIAFDLFGTENDYVIPVQSLTVNDALIAPFENLMAHENYIREILSRQIPIMKERVHQGAEAVKNLYINN